MRRWVTVRVEAAVVVAALAAAAGCKQQEGDYCQINRDCAEGLICVRATNRCQVSGTSLVDAGTPDAPVAVDAAVSVDARIVVDAAVELDAATD